MGDTELRDFASTPHALAVLDHAGNLLQSNLALVDMVPDARVGQRLHDVMGHLDSAGDLCRGGCYLDDPTQVPTRVPLSPPTREPVSAGGRVRWVECTAGRIDERCVILSFCDVTAAVHAQNDPALALDAKRGHAVLQSLGTHPQLPSVEGLGLDLASATAEPVSASGGEVVEVSRLPDGRVLIIIVDALGAGMVSVRDAWRVLYRTRALAVAAVPLTELIARTASALAGETQPPKASVLVALLDPGSGHLRVVAGGHPPALLVHENGTATWLEGTGRGIGSPAPGSRNVVEARVGGGDSLILYTRGVVDGTRDLVQGFSVLRSSATAQRRRPIDGLADSLVQAVLPTGRDHNDATILVVRRQEPSEPGLQTTTTR